MPWGRIDTSLKNVFAIYRSDIKKIIASWVMLVISLGLILLPPLYAWINIYASWDPYANTKGIKVAVVNQDAGASIKNIDFDIGSELMASLKTNDKMGWVFCDDADEAVKMAERGSVYATIIIPTDFSMRMTTVIDEKPIKPSLEYYVNEKENAIAPKMTDAVANSIQKQITASIIETAVEKAFEKFNEIGVKIDGRYPDIQKYMEMLFTLNNNVPELDGRLKNLSKRTNNGVVKINQMSDDFVFVQTTMEDAMDFNQNFSDSLLNMDARIKEYSPEIKESLITAKSLFQNISDSTGNLAVNIKENKPEAVRKIGYAIEDLGELETKVHSISDKLNRLNEENIPELVKTNQAVSDDITALKTTLQDLEGGLENAADVTNLLSDLSEANDDLADDIDSLTDIVNSTFAKFDKVLENAEKLFQTLESFLTNAAEGQTAQAISAWAASTMQQAGTLNEELKANSKLYGSLASLCNQLYSDLKKLANGSDVVAALADLKGNYRSFSVYIDAVRSNLDSKRSDITNTLDTVRSIVTQISRVCDDLGSLIRISSRDLLINIDNLLLRLTDVQTALGEANTKLLASQGENRETIKTKTASILSKISELKADLEKLKQNINDEDAFETILYDTQKLTYDIAAGLNTATTSLDDNILPRIESYLKNGSVLVGDINHILTNSQDDVDTFRGFLDDVADDGAVAADKIDAVRAKLPKVRRSISDIAELVENVNKAVGFNDIIKFMQNDAGVEGDFLSSPVNLTTHKLYTMPNYGTGLAPFYTVLSLWVGALFLVALLSTKARNLPDKCKPVEVFFGKYLLFATYAICQGLIAALGDLFILRITVHNPGLFVILSIFYSLLFTMIVYALVSTLGNVGKAVAIIFMLLQLTGSGGTFPVQVMPAFFQVIHAALPFTYAIGGMREAIYGVIYDALVKDVWMLILFFALFTAFGVFLKQPLNKLMYNATKQLRHTDVLEH